MISGCSYDKTQTQTVTEATSQNSTGNIQYLTFSSPIKGYTSYMSSVPGLPIDIKVNDELLPDNISIKVKSAYGRIFKWTSGQPFGDSVNEMDLEYSNQTIYWSPILDGGDIINTGTPILIEIIDKSNDSIIDEELIYIESIIENGLYTLAETNVNGKLYLKFIDDKEIINNNKSIIDNNIDSTTIKFLKENGINDYKYILSELESHPEIIPFEGVLGGTMKWYASETKFINNRWIYGYFEDGHVAGHAILKYTIKDDKTISWEIIDAFMD